jgi:hypothetical protein
MCSCGNNSCGGCGSISVPDGPAGQNGQGWSPQFAVVSDGPTRQVLQLTGWTGGTGAAPGGVGQYVGPSGFTPTIGSAANIRGSDGNDGADSARYYSFAIHNGQSGDFCLVAANQTHDIVARNVYPGSTYGSPITGLFNLWKVSGDARVRVDVYDATNNNILAQSPWTSLTSALNIVTVDFTAVTWPGSPVVLQIRVTTEAGTEAGIASGTFLF